MGNVPALTVTLIGLLAMAAYLLPSILEVAWGERRRWLVALNVAAGWTVIGWLVALALAATSVSHRHASAQGPPAEQRDHDADGHEHEGEDQPTTGGPVRVDDLLLLGGPTDERVPDPERSEAEHWVDVRDERVGSPVPVKAVEDEAE
jgi:hypothetical protein